LSTVYIVDDDANCAEVLQFALEHAGQKACIFNNFQPTLDALDEEVCVIVVDLHMNDMMTVDQFLLKSHTALPAVRLGFLSGDVLVHERAKRMAADFVRSKPYELDDLLNVILGFCEAAK
jgi:FixJ family two-component response regulator